MMSHSQQPVSMAANAPRQNRRWYVVHAQPWAESRAVINLERQGYEVFCPRLYRIVRHARKQTKKHLPLFPSYLFLRLDITRDQWRQRCDKIPLHGVAGLGLFVRLMSRARGVLIFGGVGVAASTATTPKILSRKCLMCASMNSLSS